MDNALCGGIISGDGIENIALEPETAKGQVYLEFQEYLKEHQKRGILLSIDSKNDYSNALAGLNHSESCLKPENFTVIKANWEEKDADFTAIAEEIRVLLCGRKFSVDVDTGIVKMVINMVQKGSHGVLLL